MAKFKALNTMASLLDSLTNTAEEQPSSVNAVKNANQAEDEDLFYIGSRCFTLSELLQIASVLLQIIAIIITIRIARKLQR